MKANLNRFAALLLFFDQTRFTPVLNSKTIILRAPSEGGFIAAIDDLLEGCYLHYWSDGKAFVRSGKAVGSDNSNPGNGIVRRNEKGHKKKAASSSLADGECFYTKFPAQANTNQLPNKCGSFEDLTLYSGFCFNRKTNTDGLTSVEEGEGLFDWSLYVNHLTTANIRGCHTLREKQLVVIGYFFEMCYDICLQTDYNVSNNPGFESILGVFDNRTRD